MFLPTTSVAPYCGSSFAKFMNFVLIVFVFFLLCKTAKKCCDFNGQLRDMKRLTNWGRPRFHNELSFIKLLALLASDIKKAKKESSCCGSTGSSCYCRVWRFLHPYIIVNCDAAQLWPFAIEKPLNGEKSRTAQQCARPENLNCDMEIFRLNWKIMKQSAALSLSCGSAEKHD